MRNKALILKSWAASIALMFLYLQCRIMYLPIFWMGFPGYSDWCTLKSPKPGTEKLETPVEIFYFINRDFTRLAIVYLYTGMITGLSWIAGWSYLLSFGAIAIASAFVFSYNWIIMRRRTRKFIRLRDLEEALEQKRKPNN